ncbi:MAG: FHA domain-containing protein [Deltaproteobacteria bacterium]
MKRAASTRKPPPFLPGGADDTVLHGAGNSLPGTPRLLVTAGPGKGAELALGHGVATLGRGAENALVIADISVSRRHARIEQRAEAWVVIDEGSGNGTRVNGTPVREQRLRDGDEIAVGGTRVRFLEAGGVAARDLPPRTSERPRPLRAQLVLCAASLVLVLAAGSGVHRWRKLESQAREVAARQHARGDLEVAAGSGRSGGEIREARAATGREARAAPVGVEARPMPKPADPPSVEPAHGALGPSRSTTTAKISPPRTRSRSAAPGWATLVRSSDKPESGADARAIVAAYRRGDLATARERAKEGRSAETARLSAALADFERACRQAAVQQAPADAVRSLEEAAAADRAIAGSGESRPGSEVRKALSAQHLLAAAWLKSDDQLPQAAAHLRAAAEANPSNQAARDAVRRLQERVHDIYLRGYVARETEPAEARRWLGLVVQALPASDETAQKAKRWLDKLEGKAAE